MSLNDLRVLSCRQKGRGMDLDAAIEEAGGVVIRVPLIEVRPPADGGAALSDAQRRLASFDWLACTSVNGVEALRGWELPPGLRLAAVGPTTAAAFEEVLGRNPLVVPAIHTAKALAAAFPPRPGRVLAPLAELASSDLADGLIERGFEVEVVTAYSTGVPDLPTAAIDAAASCDVVLVTSPSVADRLVALLGDRLPTTAVAIGPRSAAAAAERFTTVVESTPSGVLAALRDLD